MEGEFVSFVSKNELIIQNGLFICVNVNKFSL